MTEQAARTALIVGAGSGISASFARALHQDGFRIALAARNIDKLAELAHQTSARTYACDAARIDAVADVFTDLDRNFGHLDVVLYNASARTPGAVTELTPAAVANVLNVSAYGAFLVAQSAAKRMTARGTGAIFFTGASASVKGYANSSAFAMGKFALRGLAQSMARELAPKGVHVAHFVIDGGVRGSRPERVEGPNDTPDKWLDPDAIAQSY
ncbi:MAG: SDR family NAD(P)-dependent oxidoreductase, partial [Hyphomicrobiaceae bacterium]|nr:SDR family NAD(P)-dependent oxidoreductase [Hyphomicrobiaceae bacterium]